jgi:hypothetical protein
MIQKLSPTEIVQAINQMVVIFDQCAEKYDVFKVRILNKLNDNSFKSRSKQKLIHHI